jgi:hypothetical protein
LSDGIYDLGIVKSTRILIIIRKGYWGKGKDYFWWWVHCHYYQTLGW